MGRSPCCVQGVNKGAWCAQEDRKLTEYINANGEGNWVRLPQKAGLNRCGKSCRLRWIKYLKPGIKRGGFSADEDDLLIRLHNLLGNRWSLIAGRLPGRTDIEIKNYWNTALSKKFKKADHRMNDGNLNAGKKPSSCAKKQLDHDHPTNSHQNNGARVVYHTKAYRCKNVVMPTNPVTSPTWFSENKVRHQATDIGMKDSKTSAKRDRHNYLSCPLITGDENELMGGSGGDGNIFLESSPIYRNLPLSTTLEGIPWSALENLASFLDLDEVDEQK